MGTRRPAFRYWGLFLCALTLSLPASADSSVKAKAIRTSKTASARISHLSDIIFDSSAAMPGARQIEICVFANSGGIYRLTAVSGNAQGTSLRLRSGGTYITYYADWFAGLANPTPTRLSSGLATGLLGGADALDESCRGSTNARLQISLDPQSFAAAPAGTFVDTLSISVVPD